MLEMIPTISLIIPTRNRASCLAELLETLRRQTFSAWEAIIVDDGSDREELERNRELARRDPRLTFIERDTQPQGGGHCRNIGLRAAQAGLIVYFDDDDLLSPGCLEARVRAMDEAPDHDFIVFPYERFRVAPGDMHDRRMVDASAQAIDRFLRIDPPWHTGSVVWRRAFLDRLGGWNEQITSWQDWEFGLRALSLRPTCASRTEPAFFVRVASDRHRNISGAWVPKHVKSWPVAISAVLPHLRAAGLLDATRAVLLGRLYLFVAERLVEIGDRAEALRLWMLARDQGFVTSAEWWVGNVLLRAFPVPIVRERVRTVFQTLVAWNAFRQRWSPRRGDTAR